MDRFKLQKMADNIEYFKGMKITYREWWSAVGKMVVLTGNLDGINMQAPQGPVLFIRNSSRPGSPFCKVVQLSNVIDNSDYEQ